MLTSTHVFVYIAYSFIFKSAVVKERSYVLYLCVKHFWGAMFEMYNWLGNISRL